MYFGDIECILGMKTRIAGIRAITECEMHVISWKSFHSVIVDYPEVEEEMKKTAMDRIILVQLKGCSHQP